MRKDFLPLLLLLIVLIVPFCNCCSISSFCRPLFPYVFSLSLSLFLFPCLSFFQSFSVVFVSFTFHKSTPKYFLLFPFPFLQKIIIEICCILSLYLCFIVLLCKPRRCAWTQDQCCGCCGGCCCCCCCRIGGLLPHPLFHTCYVKCCLRCFVCNCIIFRSQSIHIPHRKRLFPRKPPSPKPSPPKVIFDGVCQV